MRILLIGAVVFLAAWFTILKPKSADVPPATTTSTTQQPPASSAGAAVDAAKKAAGATTETAPTQTAPETKTAPAPAPEAAPAAATIPAEALAKLPKGVAAALEAKKVLVLGVFADDAKPWRPMSDDDRYTRNALREANRYDGGVFVKNVGIDKLSTYGPLVNDLHVNQSPAVVVIDGNLKGRVLTGYVDRIAINQVIADARDAGVEPDITDPFLRELNAICGRYDVRTNRWSLPTVRGKKARVASLDRLIAIVDAYHGAAGRLKAPAKWRSLKAQTVQAIDDVEVALREMKKAYAAGDRTAWNAALASVDDRAAARLDRRYDELGATECVSNRRS
jgi:hypothetical protein